jgi:ADP-heptose:LPS heptosyltransferase
MIRPPTKTINILFQSGGVGDHIASLTAVDYILRRYPWITPLLWVPDFMKEISINLLPEHAQVWAYSEMRGRYDPSKPTKSTLWDGHSSPIKIHLLNYAFWKLVDEQPPIEEMNYLRLKLDKIDIADERPLRSVVITTGFTADVREFPPSAVNEVARYVKSKDYTPIFLGQTSTKTGAHDTIRGKFREDIDFSLGVNLIDKTTLVEAGAIMASSAAVVGVDNGLMHVAGTTDVPIIGGFTTVRPEIRMPVRHNKLGWNFFPVVPDESLSCRFCQQDTNFIYGHDYRNCLHRAKGPGFGHMINKCTKQMTPEKFIEKLEQVLCPASQLAS